MNSLTVSVYIEAPPSEVYAFASAPKNLPAWVPSFFRAIEFVDGEWLAQTPLGQVAVMFVATNSYGVLDHTVTLASGLKVTNPMRVIANGSGSEVLFTLMQHKNMSEAEFREDVSLVRRDLETLQRIMESGPKRA